MNTNMNENVKTDMEEPMDENMVERANAPRDTWGTGQVTGGKLYCRKQPQAGAAYWGRFDNNAIIPIKAYDSTWYETYWNGNTANVGYVMKQYITNENWNGTGSGSGTFIGNGTVVGGALYCRKQPQAGYAYWGQFSSGSVIPIYSCSTTGWYETRWPANGTNVGYVMQQYVSLTGSSGNLTVDEYIQNLEAFCNDGWSYGSGYNPNTKVIDCAWYPYMARNQQGAHGCTTEYNSYLSSKGLIANGDYNNLVRGMEVFQPNSSDPSIKEHMGVYAGKVVINGVLQHAVYQSCSSHNTIDAMYIAE